MQSDGQDVCVDDETQPCWGMTSGDAPGAGSGTVGSGTGGHVRRLAAVRALITAAPRRASTCSSRGHDNPGEDSYPPPLRRARPRVDGGCDVGERRGAELDPLAGGPDQVAAARDSDADMLAQLTGVPGGMWAGLSGWWRVEP